MENTGVTELRRYDERLTNLEGEIKDLQADKAEVFAEMKGRGFDVKMFREARADLKRARGRVDGEDDVYELYRDALADRPEEPKEEPRVRARDGQGVSAELREDLNNLERSVAAGKEPETLSSVLGEALAAAKADP